jgi:aryl-alcohol dehydrogenase-like predicted oxidoreductase
MLVPDGLELFPLCLGGNVFGWTADREQSFAVLDAYFEAGGNFIDTADSYSQWLPGHRGGESEIILGEWIASRGVRDQVVIATKVGQLDGFKGLGPDNIERALDGSLARLGVDYVDLYYAHVPDSETPIVQSLQAFDEVVRKGKVGAIAASNFEAKELAEALVASNLEGLTRFVALQPQYNLIDRETYEGPLQELCLREQVACFPYYALASGFLTGKYRPGGPQVDSRRTGRASAYLEDSRAVSILAALDEVAETHDTVPASVAIAWLLAQPTVEAPIASARTPEQLRPLIAGTQMRLSQSDLDLLDSASRV